MHLQPLKSPSHTTAYAYRYRSGVGHGCGGHDKAQKWLGHGCGGHDKAQKWLNSAKLDWSSRGLRPMSHSSIAPTPTTASRRVSLDDASKHKSAAFERGL